MGKSPHPITLFVVKTHFKMSRQGKGSYQMGQSLHPSPLTIQIFVGKIQNHMSNRSRITISFFSSIVPGKSDRGFTPANHTFNLGWIGNAGSLIVEPSAYIRRIVMREMSYFPSHYQLTSTFCADPFGRNLALKRARDWVRGHQKISNIIFWNNRHSHDVIHT